MPVSHALKVSIFLSEMLKSNFFTTYYKQQPVPWLISLLFHKKRYNQAATSYRRDSSWRLNWVGFVVLDRWSHMEFQLYSNRVNHLSRRCDQDLSMEDKTPCSPLLSYSNQLPPMSSACKTQHHLEKRNIRKVILDAPGLSQFAATNLYRHKYHLLTWQYGDTQ